MSRQKHNKHKKMDVVEIKKFESNNCVFSSDCRRVAYRNKESIIVVSLPGCNERDLIIKSGRFITSNPKFSPQSDKYIVAGCENGGILLYNLL